ncbi:MAG: efflux RND transporter periplasmic adaptor subunit [Oscillospiraceae bacterium]|nr:efflux RND transporter periplasmic adaptor subunit [Oscillospiraceae bacterium]
MEQVKKKKKGKKILIAVIILLLLGGSAGFITYQRNISASMQDFSGNVVETAAIEYHDISNHISVSGNVESENLVKVTSKLTAKVESLNVEIGSHVKEGDILCVFDSSELQQQYDNLLKSQQNSQNQNENTHKINQRNLENAQKEKEINLTQAQRSIDDAVNAQTKAYQKENTLVDELNTETAKRDNAKRRMDTINPEEDPEGYAKASQEYQTAEMNVQTKEASLEAIRDQLDTYDKAVQSALDAYDTTERSANITIQNYQDILDAEQFQQNSDSGTELQKLADSIAECTVTAPKSGVITSLNIAQGSIPTTDALMTIEDTDSLKITVQINEADILKIQEGMPAVVKTSATGDQEFDATVNRVVNIYNSSAQSASGMGANSGTGSGNYSAEITLNQATDSNLLIGMNAKVKIILSEKEHVLAVPYDAIVTDTDESGEESSHVMLAVTNSDGTATAKAVKIEKGMEGSYYTEIISSEIQEGDQIITSPGNYQDGDLLPAITSSNHTAQGNGADGNA